MKRYRVLSYDFDARANILNLEIKNDWEEPIKKQWVQNKIQIKEGLISQFGALSAFTKIDNFTELGALPISIIAFHNKFLQQIRDSYIIGSFYSALTGVCALGERILNQLVINLKEDFTSSPRYKKVYNKKSFDNWDFLIDTLEEWHILLEDVVILFKEFKEIRNRAIHFNPETDTNDKELSLEAIEKLQKIIEIQFSGFGGNQPWFIQGTKGAAFIKRDYESKSFVKRIIIPNCKKVGPFHKLEKNANGWNIIDDYSYEEKNITDEQFVNMFNNGS